MHSLKQTKLYSRPLCECPTQNSWLYHSTLTEPLSQSNCNVDNIYIIPKCNCNNQLFWKIALESNIMSFEALDYLTSNALTHVDPLQEQTHSKKKPTLSALIISTVPTEILHLLKINNNPNPWDLATAILGTCKTNTGANHIFLKSGVESVQLTPDSTLEF